MGHITAGVLVSLRAACLCYLPTFSVSFLQGKILSVSYKVTCLSDSAGYRQSFFIDYINIANHSATVGGSTAPNRRLPNAKISKEEEEKLRRRRKKKKASRR